MKGNFSLHEGQFAHAVERGDFLRLGESGKIVDVVDEEIKRGIVQGDAGIRSNAMLWPGGVRADGNDELLGGDALRLASRETWTRFGSMKQACPHTGSIPLPE